MECAPNLSPSPSFYCILFIIYCILFIIIHSFAITRGLYVEVFWNIKIMKQSKVLAYAHTIANDESRTNIKRQNSGQAGRSTLFRSQPLVRDPTKSGFFLHYYVLNSVPASNLPYRITLQEKLLSMCFNAAETQPRQGSSFWFHEEGTFF